jgi:hypothetical protein
VPEQEAKDAHGSAMLFLWLVLAVLVGCGIWMANTRFHLTRNQLVEGGFYVCLAIYFVVDLLRSGQTLKEKKQNLWPPRSPRVDVLKERVQVETAQADGCVLVGHETDGRPFVWNDETRSWQTIASGMSGAGKSTLLESLLQQDIARGVPIIFIDGKGEKKMLDKIMPAVLASGRMHQFRLIDPSHPEESAKFSPFWSPHGNPDEHVAFVFESFKVDGGDDFFDQHQRVYLENIARVLHYSFKKFNFYDVLVAAYDEDTLLRQMAIALTNAKITPTVTRQQRLTLEMSIHNLKSTMTDKERVSKIQGLINHLMTYMSDSLALITGPYDDLLTLEDVLNQNLILYVSLNVNVNERAVTSLGRILLQNLQLTLGQRYADTGYGVNHPFVSVLMDEFAPFAYQNFSTILQTARGANVAFLFALQNYSQLVPAGFGLKESLSTGPNNTFMLRMKDDSSAYQFRREGGETKHERVSMQVERAGLLSPALEDRGRGSRSEVYETAIRDEQLKRLPSGQMQVLMTDQQIGLKHLHVHVRRPLAHFFMGDPDDAETASYPVNCLYPSMESPMWLTDGLNLRFPSGDLEEKRNDNLRRRGRRRAQ